ncbi:hypothetical protein [Streptomyces cyaneofuscatus]|uniref:hypothetical protein n=1 Tax=Streptomyces cyaneofuscatus TaxID=66883 RepID=UPI00331E2580
MTAATASVPATAPAPTTASVPATAPAPTTASVPADARRPDGVPRPAASHDEAVAAGARSRPASGRTRPRPTGCAPCPRRPYASWTTPASSTS